MSVNHFFFFSAISLIFFNDLCAYNKKQLAMLHSQLKKYIFVECADFDLSDADLRALNLKCANFERANLKRANFSGADLKGAIFNDAKLQKTEFTSANLEEVSFTNANMNGANIRYAKLSGADFTGASVNGLRFKGARVSNGQFDLVSSKKGTLVADTSNLKKSFIRACIVKKSLDLHGDISWKTKRQWIETFIQESYWRISGSIEIITGRGLHNPAGKKGILWRTCKRYLLSKKFTNYIQDIQSISEKGGWRIALKHYSKNRNKINKIVNPDEDSEITNVEQH